MPNMTCLSLTGSKDTVKDKVGNRQTGQKQYARSIYAGHKNRILQLTVTDWFIRN